MKHIHTFESFINEDSNYINLIEEVIQRYYLADTSSIELDKDIRLLVKELCKLHNKGVSSIEISKKYPNKESDVKIAIDAYDADAIKRALPQNWESPSDVKIEKII